MKTKRVPDEAKVIGANIRAIRTARGLSQKEMAEALDVTFQQVQKYERGANRLPIDKLYLLKKKLHVPYDTFFEGMGEGSTPETLSQRIIEKLETISDERVLLHILGALDLFYKGQA